MIESDTLRLNTGPLGAPHYELALEPGVAMMSKREGDCWVVRFVYDPVNYERMKAERLLNEGEFTGEGDLPPGLGEDAFHGDPTVKPPLVVAFGDPGEPREQVEAAFLEAICNAWCQMLLRMHSKWGQDGLQPGAGHFDELLYADVWSGTADHIEYDLLCMVHAARSRNRWDRGGAKHHPEWVAEWIQREYWRTHMFRDPALETLPPEQEYFRANIPGWRNDRRPRVNEELHRPRGIF